MENGIETQNRMASEEEMVKKLAIMATEEQQQEANTWLEDAKLVKITDQSELIPADTFCKDIKRFRLKIEGDLKPAVEAAFKAYKIGKAKMDEFINPLKAAESEIKNEIIRFSREQDRIRREVEEKARRKAEEATRLEKEKLEKEAEAAAADGRTEEFEEKAAAAEEVTIEDHLPVSQPVQTAPKGTTIKDKWKAKVTDLRALVEAVHEGIVPINAIQANDVYLGQRARSDKESLKIPGVRVYNEGSVAIRT